MTINRQALIDQANDLGLEFAKNVKTTKLAGMVAEAMGAPPPVDEVAPAGPAVKPGSDEEQNEIDASTTSAPISKSVRLRSAIAERKRAAMKTSIVTVTNKDNRENSFMTTAPVGFENQYFGLSKLVPLDTPIELEQALIDIIETTMMTLHKDEIVNGKRTGNKIAASVKKFTISYSKETPDK